MYVNMSGRPGIGKLTEVYYSRLTGMGCPFFCIGYEHRQRGKVGTSRSLVSSCACRLCEGFGDRPIFVYSEFWTSPCGIEWNEREDLPYSWDPCIFGSIWIPRGGVVL